MIDQKRIDALLEELYAIQPDLRAQDAPLRALVQELLISKPDAALDEHFVERLRSELLARASAVSPKFNVMNIFSTKHRFLVPGLAVLVLAVAGATALQSIQQPGRLTSSRVAMAPSLERVNSNAFGKLSGSNGDAGSNATFMAPETAPSTASPRPQSGGGGGMGLTVDSKMVAPDWVPTIYHYVYKGEAIENLDAQIDVYRRVKAAPAVGPLSALQDANLGLVDLNNAKDAFVQSFTIAEKRDQGYVFNVDAQEGMVNIFQNGKWISPLSRCIDQNCYEQNRLKESDLLSDEESIRIADAFLVEYGISKADYGAPIVNNQWRMQYAAMDSASRSSFWFPEGISVVYPVLADGKVAYDESGYPYGLNVNVDVRMKRVQSVWNLFTRTYQVSSYAAETDVKRLLGIAENTDNYGGGWPDNAKRVDVELGTPKIAYVRAWQQLGTTGAELLVPALIFPIQNAPAELWRQNVIVPLAKDLLDALPPMVGIPMPVDAPVMMAPPEVKETK
ncbi:MAG: hypothetical protein WC866_00870 [Patescibacteria group bacterium]|jgi:hypothetical protein